MALVCFWVLIHENELIQDPIKETVFLFRQTSVVKQASSAATSQKLSPWEATSCGQGLQAQSAANYQISALTWGQKADVIIENDVGFFW